MIGNETDGAVGAAIIAMDKESHRLVAFFGGPEDEKERNIVLELEPDSDMDVLETLLGDPNMWLNFMEALAAALRQHKTSLN